ncbi:hypothetical protein GCM10009841_13450 [Microlunatus panaciterrae]
MPAAGLTFRLPAGSVQFDPDGRLLRVAHDSRSDGGYLAPGFGPGSLVVDGQTQDWMRVGMVSDADELEVSYQATQTHLSLVIRHTVTTAWGVRLAITNLGSEPVSIERASLALRPSPGYLGWALTAGATAGYAVYPADGDGPLLAWTLQWGELARATTEGLELGPIDLPPRGRYIVQWLWDFHPTPARLGRGRLGVVPAPAVLTMGQPVEIMDEDTALVTGGSLTVSTNEGVREVAAEEPGPYPIELRSGRGTTRFEVTWVRPMDQVLARAAEQVLAGPTSATGVTRLADAAAALLVQRALAEMLVADPEPAADALELFSAGLLERGRCDPFEVALLCGEWTRTGDHDLVEVARSSLLSAEAVRPGLGLAATRLCVALMMAGRPVTEVLDRLSLLRHTIGAVPSGRRANEDVLRDRLAELELIMVVQRNIEVVGDDVLRLVGCLGGYLGYGLPGQLTEPVGDDTLGYLVTILSLLPDEVGENFLDSWGVTPQALADRYRPVVLSGHDRTHQRALAWLVLGRQAA